MDQKTKVVVQWREKSAKKVAMTDPSPAASSLLPATVIPFSLCPSAAEGSAQSSGFWLEGSKERLGCYEVEVERKKNSIPKSSRTD